MATSSPWLYLRIIAKGGPDVLLRRRLRREAEYWDIETGRWTRYVGSPVDAIPRGKDREDIDYLRLTAQEVDRLTGGHALDPGPDLPLRGGRARAETD